METLVEMAKRLGIKPNPKMRDDYYTDYILPMLRTELEKRVKGVTGLEEDVYRAHKHLPKARPLDISTASYNVKNFKTKARPQIRILSQSGDPINKKDMGKDVGFVWHKGPSHGKQYKERFQIDLKMDSPQLGQIFDRLDDFVLKHHAGYKIVDLDGKKEHKRTDSLNLYMSEEITPEVTKELYSIISPVLEDKYDDYLNGLPVKFNGKNVKGFRYGPEPIAVGRKNEDKYAQWIRQVAKRDLPPGFELFIENCQFEDELSLGQLCARIEKADLIYYLVGKEGKSPFQLGNQFGIPNQPKYDKVIDIGRVGHHSLVKAPVPQKTPTPPKQPTTKSPVDKLKPQRFIIGKTGVRGCKYLDAKGNVVITETYHANCVKRVYANGLTMQMWENPRSTTYTDGSKTGKNATEIIVTEMGRGCTKDITTSGELKRKIEAVRKAGLLVTTLPDTPKKSSTIKGRLMHHSVDNAKTTMARSRISKKVPTA